MKRIAEVTDPPGHSPTSRVLIGATRAGRRIGIVVAPMAQPEDYKLISMWEVT
ncbi:MAG TPA: hypothetical protein VGO93_29540 [Candidatus Xenobia bacterium]